MTCWLACIATGPQALAQESPEKPSRPALQDFLGLNGHYTFRPALYRPTVRLVRNYHSMEWDVGGDTSFRTEFPFARNRVHWENHYRAWQAEGFRIEASIQFESIPVEKWNDLAQDAERYGQAFASFFGPSSRNLIEAAEIGNEPGKFNDEQYRTLFQAMSKGMRRGDPKLQIATCNMVDGKSHDYAKSLDCLQGLSDAYDIINLHVYAEAEPWPTWRRSYPEDPTIAYLKEVEKVCAWRDANAPGKPVWITEFGWDCSTKSPDPKTEFAKWVDVSDLQQAQYLIRSTLIFMSMDVARAYIYFYDDSDQPSLHAASGITRNFEPKPSYHALAQLQRILGPYRFDQKVIVEAGKLMVYKFTLAEDSQQKDLGCLVSNRQ
jgi:serine/threonine-protein kinase ATR